MTTNHGPRPRMIAPYLPPFLPPALPPALLSPFTASVQTNTYATKKPAVPSHLTLRITVGGYLLFHYADEVTHPVSPSARSTHCRTTVIREFVQDRIDGSQTSTCSSEYFDRHEKLRVSTASSYLYVLICYNVQRYSGTAQCRALYRFDKVDSAIFVIL